MKQATVRITVTLDSEVFNKLVEEAKQSGVPTPTYARLLLTQVLMET